MEITIKATKVQKVSIKSKYDDDKLELTSTIQADVQLHPSNIARLTNLLMQKVPLYLTIGSVQAQFDLEMVKREPPEPAPAQEPVGEPSRIVMLDEDAALHTNPGGNDISLHYDGFHLGLPVGICPPVDQLKKGAILKLLLDRQDGTVYKVEMAEPKDIADQHLTEQMEHDFEKIGEERDRMVKTEDAALKDNGAKPKRHRQKVR